MIAPRCPAGHELKPERWCAECGTHVVPASPFTREDVEAARDAAGYLRISIGAKTWNRDAEPDLRELSERADALAARIAALLPPA